MIFEDYHERVFELWKSDVYFKKKKKTNHRSRKRKTDRLKRNKSLGGLSDETNETEYPNELNLDIEELIRLKLNSDIQDFADEISEKANLFFDRKVEAFSRLEYLFEAYFETEIHLYGSLACGLAV